MPVATAAEVAAAPHAARQEGAALAGYLDVLEACACVCGLETVASCVYMWVYIYRVH